MTSTLLYICLMKKDYCGLIDLLPLIRLNDSILFNKMDNGITPIQYCILINLDERFNMFMLKNIKRKHVKKDLLAQDIFGKSYLFKIFKSKNLLLLRLIIEYKIFTKKDFINIFLNKTPFIFNIIKYFPILLNQIFNKYKFSKKILLKQICDNHSIFSYCIINEIEFAVKYIIDNKKIKNKDIILLSKIISIPFSLTHIFIFYCKTLYDEIVDHQSGFQSYLDYIICMLNVYMFNYLIKNKLISKRHFIQKSIHNRTPLYVAIVLYYYCNHDELNAITFIIKQIFKYFSFSTNDWPKELNIYDHNKIYSYLKINKSLRLMFKNYNYTNIFSIIYI